MTRDELTALFHADLADLQAVFYPWLDTRPDCIKQLAAKYPPTQLYRLKDMPACPTHADHNGAIGAIQSYFEDGKVRFRILHIPTNPEACCDHILDPSALEPVVIE